MEQQPTEDGKLVIAARLAARHYYWLLPLGWFMSVVLSVLTTMYIKSTVAATREEQSLRGRIDDFQDKVSTLEKRLMENSERCKELESILEKSRIDRDSVTSKLAAVESKVKDLLADVKALGQEIGKRVASSNLETNSQEIQDLRADILKLQKKIEALNNALTALLNQ